MAAPAYDSAEPVVDGAAPTLDLRAAARNAWTNLSVLLLGSGLVAVAALLAVIGGRAGVVVALVVGALAVPPPLMALVRVCVDVIDGQEPPVRELFRHLRRLSGRAIGICAVPAVLIGLTATALLAHELGGRAVMLVPVALGTTATVLVLVGGIVALPLRAVHADPTGVRAWLLALHLFARTPVPFLAAIVVGGLGVSLSLTVSNGLFLLVPAPFALVLAAAFRAVPPLHRQYRDRYPARSGRQLP